MELEKILLNVIKKLEESNIEYMIVGSLASNIYGSPRTTLDADIVICADIFEIENFIKSIKKEFYADLEMAKDALNSNGAFNIINYETGFKIDLIILKKDDYFLTEFERRIKQEILGTNVFFASLEDTILSKLLWAKSTESQKQKNDVISILKIQKNNIDLIYLNKWAKKLNVKEILDELLKTL